MTHRVHEADLELVDALQVNPRATWDELGAALGVAPVTAARRWRRLEECGLAWVSAAIGQHRSLGAVLEVRCAPGDAARIAAELARRPDIITVGLTTGDFQLFAVVLADGLAALTDVLADELSAVPGALQVRHSVFGALHGGVHWRQGILSDGESRAVAPAPGQPPARVRPLGPGDAALFRHLNARGRASMREVARAAGVPEHTARRRVAALAASGELIWRCDVARPLFDLPLGVFLLLEAGDTAAERAVTEIGAWRETRLCARVVGAANIVLIASLHQLSELDELCGRVTGGFPGIRVADRRVVLRSTKIYGRLLDPHTGRATGTVPVDPWSAARRRPDRSPV
ncbi:AsnC family transcriptional regulator [Nocardiopsis coralliicola]